MVTPEQLRKALGSDAEQMSDEEVKNLNEQLGKLAGALFGMWRRDSNRQSAQLSGFGAPKSGNIQQ